MRKSRQVYCNRIRSIHFVLHLFTAFLNYFPVIILMIGTLWANSELEVSVLFRPDTAANYNCLLFLDVAGREDRLPLR